MRLALFLWGQGPTKKDKMSLPSLSFSEFQPLLNANVLFCMFVLNLTPCMTKLGVLVLCNSNSSRIQQRCQGQQQTRKGIEDGNSGNNGYNVLESLSAGYGITSTQCPHWFGIEEPLVLISKKNWNQRTTRSGSLKNSGSKNRWFWFFRKTQRINWLHERTDKEKPVLWLFG
jgi:hypothetical protein